MSITIFGGKGFMGKALQEKLRLEHNITVFDLPESDIKNPETFKGRFLAAKPDTVINLAAILGGVKNSLSINDFFEVNVMGNLKLLKISYEIGVRNYIFLSSLSIYGENKIGEHRLLSSPFNPKHSYGASKAAAELGMMQFMKEASEMKIITLRPTMVLGENTPISHAPIEFIKTLLSGKDIEIYGDGLHEREWLWIDDMIRGIIKAVEYSSKSNPGYHPFILSGNKISMRDLANKIIAKLGGRISFRPSTAQAFTLTSDASETTKILNWRLENDISAIIDKLSAALKK